MKTLTTAAVVLTAATSVALADPAETIEFVPAPDWLAAQAEPTELTDQQMDQVTAGISPVRPTNSDDATKIKYSSSEDGSFVRSGFSEVRFGDEDGAVDNSAIGAYTIAVGTGN
jgi:hypothetical protein